MRQKMQDITKVKVKAWCCLDCKYIREKAVPACREAGHMVTRSTYSKRFWSCRKCKKRTTTLGVKRPPTRQVCRKCGAYDWVAAGMVAPRKAEEAQLSVKGGPEIMSLRYR